MARQYVTDIIGEEYKTWEDGDQIIIAALGYDYAMSTTQNTNNRGQVGVTKSSGGLSYDADAQIITLTTGTVSGSFGFKVGDSKYLYAPSSSAMRALQNLVIKQFR